jgi:hypothetical protein
MASIDDRLARLEARTKPSYVVPLYLRTYLKEFENIQRTQEGLDPIPLTPEEEAESERGDREFLEECIPRMRAQGGSPETLAMIDEWEEHAKREMTK